MNISEFIDHHYRHFNAASLKDAAQAYKIHINKGGKMLVTLAGAMSTAELGISLSEMIRQNKVHAISCTAANIEEDLFHLVAAQHYKRIPNYRYLTKEDDLKLCEEHNNRVTDTCIPEEEAMRVLEKFLDESWSRSNNTEESLFWHEHYYRIIREGGLIPYYQKDPKTSWLLAACEKNLPILVPCSEDSTTGNMFEGKLLLGKVKSSVVKSGMEYMADWLKMFLKEAGIDFETKKIISQPNSWGMFQIGGGSAGDAPICIVPTLNNDMRGIYPPVPLWDYFCQISDSVTSYGSYSGATPNEKITWSKLRVDTPMFVIESDATIVAPLIFAYVLGL
jgi:deoxyhypusine synthase